MLTLLQTRSSGPDRPPFAPESARDTTAFDAALAGILSGVIPVVHHFQPIVDLKRGVVAGYEALARFPAALGSAPDVCIRAAACAGKQLQLEEVITRAAIRCRALLPPDCFLTLNVSPAFLASKHWDAVCSSVLDLSGLVIEITEEESIADYEVVRRKLKRIRALGGSVAVDDACAGYASLQHILEIKPGFIKLDRALIMDCCVDRAKSVLIEMMGQAANRLNAWIIAEGMETQQELAELIELGVPLAQGFYLGLPHPVMQSIPEEKSAWIRAQGQRRTSTARLAPHIEVCPTRPDHAAARHLLATEPTATVVVTDIWNRPLSILERHPVIGERGLPNPMKIQISSDPAEVLHRALTRPVTSRFDPFAVIDGRGVLQGIIRVDRLMSAMLEAKTA